MLYVHLCYRSRCLRMGLPLKDLSCGVRNLEPIRQDEARILVRQLHGIGDAFFLKDVGLGMANGVNM